MDKVLIIFISMILTSCFDNQNDDLIHISKQNKINLIINNPVFVDSLINFQLVLQDNGDEIIEGYYNCGHLQHRKFDLEQKILSGCDNKLVLENDTIKLWTTFDRTGLIKFDDITIIIKDKNNNLCYIDTTFIFEISPR
jgi:hypothetical protein